MTNTRNRYLRRLRLWSAVAVPLAYFCHVLATRADVPPPVVGAASAVAALVDPAYGAWHSCTMSGGGNLVNTLICPSNPKRIYTYGDMDGLFRSDDGGLSWRIIHGGMDIKQGHYGFAGIVVNPHNADEIAVACGDQFGPRGGVFLSTDGGKTWARTLEARFMGNGPFRYAGSRLAGSCAKNGLVIAAGEGSGVFRSEDGGRTWQDCGLNGIFFTDVYIDRTNNSRVWLCAEPVDLGTGSEYGKLAGGEYRSDDGGKAWSKLSDDSPFELIQDPVDSASLYGLWDEDVKRSTDAGATWQDFSAGLPKKSDLTSGESPFYALGVTPRSTIVIQTHPTTVYTVLAGQTQWQKIDPIFSLVGWRLTYVHPPADNPSSVTVSPTDPNHWYMTDEFGVYQTWDGGHNWKSTNQGIETTVIYTVDQDPSLPTTAYLGAGDVGFWQSDDLGSIFTQTDSSAAGWVGNIKCIDASSRLPSRVYAVGGEGWKSDRVYVSTDHGKSVSWLPMHGTGLPAAPFCCDSIAVDPRDSNSVYVTTSAPITTSSGGVYHSSDGGASWQWAGQGLPSGATVFLDNIWWGGRELGIGADGVLLAVSANCNSVYRFDSTLKTWSALSLPHAGGMYSIVADFLTPGRFYVCVIGDDTAAVDTDGGLYRTDDNGATWKKIVSGSIHAVAVDRAVKGRIAASTRTGVMLSIDGGDSWAPLEAMPNRWFNESLAFASDRLIAATGGNGAFWISVRRTSPAAANPNP